MIATGGELDLLGRPITPRRARLMVRSIWKSTLELIYLDAGPRIAFLEIFDSARHATLDDHSRGWATLDRNTAATASVDLEYERAFIAGRHAIPVTLNAFGVRSRTDLLRRDLTEDEFRPTMAAQPLDVPRLAATHLRASDKTPLRGSWYPSPIQRGVCAVHITRTVIRPSFYTR